MKRTPLARGTKRMKRTAIKHKARKPSEFARIYGSRERVGAIKALRCYACGKESAENAHTGSGGMGRKAGWETIVNLGPNCHTLGKFSLHKLGSVELFDAHHGTDLRARAAFLAEYLKP